MRTLVLILLLLIAWGGYLLVPVPPQDAIAGQRGKFFAYQVPGSWEQRDNDSWREKRKPRLNIAEGRVDPRTRKVREITSALEVLDSSGLREAVRRLYQFHAIDYHRVPADRAALDALWEQVTQTREMFKGSSATTPDPKKTEQLRERLQTLLQGYAKLDGDLESRARRLGDTLHGPAYNFAEAPFTEVVVDGSPAAFLQATGPTKSGETDYIGLLVFEFDKELVGMALRSNKPVELVQGETLAASIQLHADKPKAAPRPEKKPLAEKMPDSAWMILLVLGVAALPAALGAASGYGPARGGGVDRTTSAGAGAFFFTGVSMAVGICGVFIYFINGMANAPSSSGGLMVGVALFIFLGIFAIGAVITWITTCYMASVGARWGARVGKFASAAGAAVTASIGLVGVAVVFGFLR